MSEKADETKAEPEKRGVAPASELSPSVRQGPHRPLLALDRRQVEKLGPVYKEKEAPRLRLPSRQPWPCPARRLRHLHPEPVEPVQHQLVYPVERLQLRRPPL